MAAAATTSSLWVAIGVGVAAVVVAAAVFVGPSVVECAQDEAGFGACLRTKMVEVSSGLPTVDAPTEVAAEPNAGTQQQETAQAEPEEKAAALTAPVLGLVRAEPDGSVVIAGSAVAGRTLEIYAGGKLLGTVTTESSGDWVLVPDERLPIGGVEITVVDTQTNQVSEQSVVVAIAQDRTSEPLVVASTPGQASNILQGLIVAEAEPAVQLEAEVVEPEVIETATNQAADAVSDINKAIESTSQHLQLADAPTIDVPAAVQESAEQEAAEQVETAKADALDKAIGDVEELEKQVAALEAAIPPTIDAIEIDGDRNFFAGTGQDGATIRVYVDNQPVGDTVVESGHWLLEVDSVLEQKSQRVRADQLGEGSSEVASRAEVEFIFDLPAEIAPEPEPEAEAEIVVAEAKPEPEAVEVKAESAVAEPAEMEAKEQVQPESQKVVEQKTMDTAQVEVVIPKPDFGIDTGIPVVVVPEVVETVEESKPAEMVADAKPDTMPAPEPVNTDTQTEVAEVVKPDMEPTAEAAVPQLIAKPTGASGQERFVSGRAIIRRGDNLWTIARRVYGDGYRFSAIYQANKGQIRDPDLIYPGQVFDLPE